MKRLIFALTIVGASLALVSSGVAQGPPGGPGGPGGMRGPGGGGDRRAEMKKREDAMFAQLKLTPDQKKKIEVLRKDRDAKMAKAMMAAAKAPPAGGPPPGGPPPGGPPGAGGRGGGGRGGGFAAMRPIMKEYRDKLNAVLKPDQVAKLDALRKAARAAGGGRGGPGGPGGPGGGPGAGRRPGG